MADKINQQELMQALAKLTDNPELIKAINKGAFDGVGKAPQEYLDQMNTGVEDVVDDEDIIPNITIYPFDNFPWKTEGMEDFANNVIGAIVDSWVNRPESMDDLDLFLELSENDHEHGVWTLTMIIHDEDDAPILNYGYTVFMHHPENTTLKQIEVQGVFEDDWADTLDELVDSYQHLMGVLNASIED